MNHLKKIYSAVLDTSKFYWNGTKQIYYDTKKANQLKKELVARKATRNEILFIRRVHLDQVKVIPFVIISFIPFSTIFLVIIAWAFPFYLPTTLQPKNYRKKMIQKQIEFRDTETYTIKMELIKIFPELAQYHVTCTDFPFLTFEKFIQIEHKFKELRVQELKGDLLNSLTRFTFPSNYTKFLSDSVKINYLNYYILKISQDDELLREMNIQEMPIEEVIVVLHRRGFHTNYPDQDLRRMLELWLKHTENLSSKSLLLILGPFFWK